MALYDLAKPLLFSLPPETAHHLGINALKTGLPLYKKKTNNSPMLKTSLWGLEFSNPIGMAAGFDKNAEVIQPLFNMGFGFVEVGTVTPKAQEGNPCPRIFRNPKDIAVINRMGFPNQGMERFLQRVLRYRDKQQNNPQNSEAPVGVLGINIGMNKDQSEPAEDYCQLIHALGPHADYLTINISSPNTPGLRNLQEKTHFINLIQIIKKSCIALESSISRAHPPLLVKLAPDLSEEQQQDLAQAALECGIQGLILTNTTLSRPENLPESFAKETGGLSGGPLKDLSTEVIRSMFRKTQGKIPIIGVGGIASGKDAYEKIKAGASLVQLYSAFIFQGPQITSQICSELEELLAQDGLRSIQDAIGLDASYEEAESAIA